MIQRNVILVFQVSFDTVLRNRLTSAKLVSWSEGYEGVVLEALLFFANYKK